MIRRLAPLVLALLAVGCPLAGTGGTNEPAGATGPAGAIESGTVESVVDGDTLDVRLGRGVVRVRLIGVDAPELDRDSPTANALGLAAAAFVRSTAGGKPVRLERDAIGDTRDAYGRLLRHVWLPDDVLLNREIIARGYARALTRFPFSRASEFRRAESAAASAGLGLWATTEPLRLAPDEATAHVGARATVCGPVASTRYARRSRGRPTYLNLVRPYPDQPFTVVIWGDARPRFGRPERELEGEAICVSGTIELSRGVPRIVAHDPEQITR